MVVLNNDFHLNNYNVQCRYIISFYKLTYLINKYYTSIMYLYIVYVITNFVIYNLKLENNRNSECECLLQHNYYY